MFDDIGGYIQICPQQSIMENPRVSFFSKTNTNIDIIKRCRAGNEDRNTKCIFGGLGGGCGVGGWWGGVGPITSNCTYTLTWCSARDIFSCTYRHTSCYARDIFSCTHIRTSCTYARMKKRRALKKLFPVKHGQLLARLSPRWDVYVFWGFQKPSPRPSKS